MGKIILIFERWKFLFYGILLIIPFIIIFIYFPTSLDTMKPTTQILIAALTSMLLALIISYIGIKTEARIQYFDDLTELNKEMRINFEKICAFPKIIEKNCNTWEDTGKWTWVNPKELSYTNWGDGENFHFKYCNSSAYFNFVNKGHIIHNYVTIPTQNIANFYQFCIRFSIDLQKIENQIINQRKSIATEPQCLTLDSSNSTTTSRYIVTVTGSDNETDHTSEESNIIQIDYNGKTHKFGSRKQVCDFLKNDFYSRFAEKNVLNDGIKGEYKSTMESLNKYFDQKDIFGEKIMDETTRRNKIEKMSLKSDLQSSYYIVLGILFALFAFIIQTPNYTDLIKLIYSVIIGIVVIALIWRFYSEMNEINQLFP